MIAEAMPAEGIVQRRPEAGDWQRQMREAIRSLPELLRLLGLDAAAVGAEVAASDFPILVPRAFAARMRPGDPKDPLLRQVLPLRREREAHPAYVADPVGDLSRLVGPGVIHKYPGRVLLIATGACAVHCRYCFRRHFPYAEELAARARWAPALAAIAADPSIAEVIVSGGDPLSLTTARLAELTAGLAAIPHVRRLRIHTRWPVVLPARVDQELLSWLGTLPWPVTVVVHANHAREIDEEVAAALRALRGTGAVVLNQAVLLAGVNASLAAQAALCERLGDLGVLPYYLHLLDPVAGAAHFAVPARRGRALVRGLRERLPGYLVPRLVRELPGRRSKTLLG
jgi:EF-P beta-lysylation protein EpmB